MTPTEYPARQRRSPLPVRSSDSHGRDPSGGADAPVPRRARVHPRPDRARRLPMRTPATWRSVRSTAVRYLRYWYDEATGKVFCLVDAPTAEAADDGPSRGARAARRPHGRGEGRELVAPGRPGKRLADRRMSATRASGVVHCRCCRSRWCRPARNWSSRARSRGQRRTDLLAQRRRRADERRGACGPVLGHAGQTLEDASPCRSGRRARCGSPGSAGRASA